MSHAAKTDLDATDDCRGECMPAEPWVSIPEATAFFSVSRDLLYQLMREGYLEYLRIGQRGRRVRLGAVEDALRRRAAERAGSE